jgi:hypothetical protein
MNHTARPLLKNSDANAPMSGARNTMKPGTMTSQGPKTPAKAQGAGARYLGTGHETFTPAL